MSNPGRQQQMAESGTHKLPLKPRLKEEEVMELVAHCLTIRELRLRNIRREITVVYCTFFLFHSVLILRIFCDTALNAACCRSWFHCLCSLVCSVATARAIRVRADAERHAERLLERDVEDGRLLARCVEEVKQNGEEFDLRREVRRVESLRVEAGAGGGGPAAARKWSQKDFATVFFFLVSGAVLGLNRFLLCR